MKRIFTFSSALMLFLAMNADSVKVLTLGMGQPGIDEPQLMGLGISSNGRYVCGAVELGDGLFVYDLENDGYSFDLTDDPEGAELRHVDNNGLAIGFNGPGVTYSIDGVQTDLEGPENCKYVLGEDITSDGSTMIGSIVMAGYVTYAAYSKDGGEWQTLPLPSDEELGYYAGEGSSAKWISSDGRVIAGFIGNFGPAVLWEMNGDGEYEINTLYSNYVAGSDDELEVKPFLGLTPCALSDNGKYLLCRAMLPGEGYFSYSFAVAVYDTESKTMKVYDEPQAVDEYEMGLYPSAIADNGTFVGLIGEPFFGGTGSFIMRAGETQAETLIEAFPAYGELFMFPDMFGVSLPTDMSADGRYIIGYSPYAEDFFNDEAFYVTYVIDTMSNPDAVETVAVPMEGCEEIYTINGTRVNELTNGINIVRMSDGSVRKVMRK